MRPNGSINLSLLSGVRGCVRLTSVIIINRLWPREVFNLHSVKESIEASVFLAIISAVSYHWVLPAVSLSSSTTEAVELWLAGGVFLGVVFAVLHTTVYVCGWVGVHLYRRWSA